MTTRRSGKRQPIRVWFAVVCSVAFFGASNYCNLEAFTAHSAHGESSHHAAAPTHHDEESSSAPVNHHEDESAACCAAMQAVTTPKADFYLTSSSAWQLHPLVVESSWITSLLEPSRTASGLSPPVREPPPARPFYRTTFASHAPPAYLA